MGEPLRISPISRSPAAPPVARASWVFTVVEADHPSRDAFEAFVEGRYAACFDARLQNHYPRLVGLVGWDGAPRAVAGVRFADEEPLFLERYLDAPIEDALAADRPVDRRGVVEIGSLASEGPCAALALFRQLAAWLGLHDRRVAVATVTPRLQRLLLGAGFDLRRVSSVDPARADADPSEWGGYYQTGPAVFAGDIPDFGPDFSLADRRRRLRGGRP